jgi:hypothetical protein
MMRAVRLRRIVRRIDDVAAEYLASADAIAR